MCIGVITLGYCVDRWIGKDDIASAVCCNVYLGQDSMPTYLLVTPSRNTSNGMAKINKYFLLFQVFFFMLVTVIFLSAIHAEEIFAV